MMGCQPQHHPQSHASYSLAATPTTTTPAHHQHPHPQPFQEQTVPSSQRSQPLRVSPHIQSFEEQSLPQPSCSSQRQIPDPQRASQSQFRSDLASPQVFYTPVSSSPSASVTPAPAATQVRFQHYAQRDTLVQQQQQHQHRQQKQQRFMPSVESVVTHHQVPSRTLPQQFVWASGSESVAQKQFTSPARTQQQFVSSQKQFPSPAVSQREQFATQAAVSQREKFTPQAAVSQREQFASQATVSQREQFTPQATVSQREQFASQATVSQREQFLPEAAKTGVSQYQPPAEHEQAAPYTSLRHPAETIGAHTTPRHPAETVSAQHLFAQSSLESGSQPAGSSCEVASLQLPQPSFPHRVEATTVSHQHFPQQSETVSAPLQYRQPPSSPLLPRHHHQQQQQQQYYQLSPTSSAAAAMLDKKPTLQVTTDHSPVSPASSASSPLFIFPDSHSHAHPGSDSSPFMSPVKREVKWEVGTPPQASELDAGHHAQRERVRMHSGDTELSETLVDSETGSSLLEDSSSSREQSPFSGMAESLSLRSPSEHSPSQHSPSPLTRKVFQRQTVTVTSEDEGEEGEGGQGGGGGDGDFHPSKFKKRLHERYVLSLQDAPPVRPRVKEEAVDCYEVAEGESLVVDSKRPVSKIERPDSPSNPDSPMPKSPRRSSSDTDMVRGESGEVGASSADEGDVFMEPTLRVRTKHKPPSLHQREPLDLSRGTVFSGFRSSSGSASSPLIDTEHLSPASKMFSPVFRSPHRLPYSPHGMLSPQSQSPLCSVPEGGRIFNFNVPSPLEGAHSDTDLISPSPMSPRIFTFPPQGSILNPMSEVNRLAVSPRAPYTPPPPMMHGKLLEAKWGGDPAAGFYGKRSLSESDMTYLCPVCGQAFPTNDNLAKHMAKHLPTETVRVGDSNKVHYCKVCNRSFSRSDMLTRHMRLHTGLKPYECMECGQVFSRSDHLNTHRRTHTGEKPYRCPHCPYAACRRDMITRHMRTHAKRTSRRARYLSVPDDGEGHMKGGSISSTETTDSQDYSTAGHTCSVSSVDSVDSETAHPSRRLKAFMGASVDSLLSPDPDLLTPPSRSAASSRKTSEEIDEGMEGGGGPEGGGGSQYDRFMRYRKARNWSTTSLESVDSEEALIIREALVDEAFDVDYRQPAYQGEGGTLPTFSSSSSSSARKDVVGLDTKTLQKCFISQHPQSHPQSHPHPHPQSHPPGSGSSSSS